MAVAFFRVFHSHRKGINKAVNVVLLFTLLCLSGLQTRAQDNFRFINSARSQKISFSYHRNLIIIPVMINGRGPYNFILDTGVNFIILTNSAIKDSLGLQIARHVSVKGLGDGGDTQAGVINGLHLKIGEIAGNDFSAAILEDREIAFSSYVGMPVDGIIGYDFFKNFTVKIDYSQQELTVYNEGSFQPGKKFISVPLSIENLRPFVHASGGLAAGEKIKVKLILDTGAGHPVSLDAGSDPAICVPAEGFESQLGVGLNGPIEGKLSRISNLQVGSTDLKNIICSFPIYKEELSSTYEDQRNGNMGNEILERFFVVIDYQHSMLYLKPNHLVKRPFEYDMSGLDLIAAGKDFRRFVVSGTDPGSPAEQAGLKEKDELLYINLIPASDYSITDIDRLMRSGDKKKINIMYERGGHIGITNLVLKRRV